MLTIHPYHYNTALSNFDPCEASFVIMRLSHLTLFAAISFLLSSCKGISKSEKKALCSIINSTDVANALPEWKCESSTEIPVTDPCISSWQGITCANNTVVIVDLEALKLNGTIPRDISGLSSLTDLNLCKNYLQSSIPPEIGDLIYLQTLNLSFNNLNHTIPVELTKLRQLEFLRISYNRLSSSIPTEFGNMVNLTNFRGGFNYLTSTIPESLGNLTKLTFLSFGGNNLNGSIPISLGQLKLTTTLLIGNNFLEMNIPESIAQLTNLLLLDLHNNSLTGSVPSAFGKLSNLGVLLLNTNHLTGTIDDSIWRLPNMSQLSLFRNNLRGRVPGDLFYNSNLVELVLSDNKFFGGFPTNSSAVNLQYLVLRNNKFTGTITDSFMQQLRSLSVVDISGNAFIGSIPTTIGLLSKLHTVVMSKNCFSGPIPNSLCQLNKLEQLYINGISQGDDCANQIKTVNVLSSFLSIRSLPECLLNMSSLTDLHISSNQLTGTVPSFAFTSGSNLKSFNMAHNHLWGTINPIVFNMSFSYFDVSYNKITGSISNIPADPKIVEFNARVNRISGHISIKNLNLIPSLDILNDNIFECSKDGLPSKDPAAESYACGSKNLDNAYICSYVVFVIVILVVSVRNFGPVNTPFPILQSFIGHIVFIDKLATFRADMSQEEKFPHTTGYIKYLQDFKALVSYIAAAVFILPLITFPSIKTIDPYNSPISYQYSWFVSGAFLSGKSPAYAIFSNWITIETIFSVCIYKFHQKYACNFQRSLSISTVDDDKYVFGGAVEGEAITVKVPLYLRIFGIASLVLFNVFCNVAANFSYIYAITFGSAYHIMIVQIFLINFKVIWCAFCIPHSVGFVFRRLHLSRLRSIPFMTGLFISVYVLSPVFVELCVDSSCFRRLLQPGSPLKSTYTLKLCSGYNQDNSCYDYMNSKQFTELIPPFTYNNTCVSSTLVNYIPILVYTYVINTLLPIVMYFISVLDRSKFSPKIILLLSWAVQWPANNESYTPKDIPKVAVFMSHQIMNLCVLVTFGLTSPVLAVVILMAIYTESLLLQIRINKFLKFYLECKSKEVFVEMAREKMEEKAKNCWRIPRRCLWLLSIVGSIFYLLYTLDVLSDRHDVLQDSIPIIVIILCYPFLIWLLFQIIKSRRNIMNSRQDSISSISSSKSPMIEM